MHLCKIKIDDEKLSFLCRFPWDSRKKKECSYFNGGVDCKDNVLFSCKNSKAQLAAILDLSGKIDFVKSSLVKRVEFNVDQS